MFRFRFLFSAYCIVHVALPVFVRPTEICAADETLVGRPNVVIVMTDDQGYGDLSCHGNPVLQTPQLDRLYAESVRLTDYHVAPTCSPTRAAFLTGHWTNRTGVWHTIMGRSMLRENEVTIGDAFSKAGYATGMFGKWHLGDNYPYRPEDRGFTEVMRHGGGGVGQTPDHWDNAYFDGAYWHNREVTPVQGYCTDVFFNYAKAFIRTSVAEDQPFLAYIATNAPHGPMHSPEQYSKPYAEQGKHVANFYGMIANIDENVGKLRELLDELDIADNTIFIYTTDNGTSSGDKVFNAGMRGRKGSHYDGGHRVPFFIRWPEAGLDAGRDVDTITSYVDVVPTLISMCRIAPPPQVAFDGVDLSPLIFDRAEDWPDRFLVTDSQRVKDPIKWKSSAVMSDRWRLCNGKELFDMDVDPGQKKDVSEKHPDVVAAMREFYDQWWAELEPSFAQSTAIHLGHPTDNPARLTSHDWITTKMTPWNQSQVRAALNGDANTGFWNVKVTEPGRYRFLLRRWPVEVNGPLTQSLAAGKPVPGDRAYRETPGKAIAAVRANLVIGKRSESSEVDATASEVAFDLDLEAQSTKLWASFETASGEEFGAYFVYVERL
ncbi:arylsulfatase [Rhodopirellula sp. MGV]|uniref:arylsulfatase n=1 Tax=Rhodopirellula sp. MGV TaxID=2023130 RepID=UPI000B96DC6A|nr:arylsulfatase [Rhodopirellula sp. MGV]OYP28966.1 N-acetylgalactosamine-4-sulfatase [Rhodopirellula sp. MGV]PNY36919.1 N-acetylgalactosamine-4-sulfatase [Rhodopirellula baltica]